MIGVITDNGRRGARAIDGTLHVHAEVIINNISSTGLSHGSEFSFTLSGVTDTDFTIRVERRALEGSFDALVDVANVVEAITSVGITSIDDLTTFIKSGVSVV